MPTKYTPPDPAELALLLQGAHFQHPTQQPIFAAYATGEIGSETTVFRLVQEALQRAPLETAKRAAAAVQRADLLRIEAEMTANETADTPTFMTVVVASKSVGKP